MNTVATLLALGFERHADWDFAATQHYRLQRGATVFRAYVVESNPPGVYVRLGLVGDSKGRAHFRDCISEGSVARKLDEACNTRQWPTELGLTVTIKTPVA
jgi:hypothetical protein